MGLHTESKMDNEGAIRIVEESVPKSGLEQKAKEELLCFLGHKANASSQPVVDAVVLGLVDVCEFLLLSGCDIDEIDTNLDNTFWSPLMYAISSGRNDIFNLLLDNGADIHYWAVEQEQCPLGLAAYHGQTEMFFELVRRGAQLDLEYYDEIIYHVFRYTMEELLSDAICSRNEKIARYLVGQGCKLDAPLLPGPESIREFARRTNALDFLNLVKSKQ